MSGGRFVARFSARLVESFRGDWRQAAEPVSDPGVAIDLAEGLRSEYGPAVIRAEASGGSKPERAAVSGDWLCDPSAGWPNRRLPRRPWRYDLEAARWSAGREPVEAWELCRRADWMIRAAAGFGVPPRAVVAANCACASAAVEAAWGSAASATPPVRRALSSARAWSERGGDPGLDEALVGALAAPEDPSLSSAQALAASAAMSAVWAAQIAASAAVWREASGQETLAGGLAADFAARAGEGASSARASLFVASPNGPDLSFRGRGSGDALASAVRGHVGTLEFLRAVASAG